ncbi:PD-(D/E)XK nuclease family protein, partial [bacterium]|nr:PD-(D/E)XK nuclease family protein [bacterium]
LAYLQESTDFSRILAAEHARFHEPRFTEYEGALSSAKQDEVQAWIRQTTALLSASQLETYWTCPFRWFASRVLDLETIEEPDILSEHDPLVRGSLIHEILEEFYRGEKKAERIASLTADDWPRLREFSVNKFREFADKQPAELYVIWMREQAKILELLERFFIDDVTHRENFLPERFEWKFGQPERQVKFMLDAHQEIYLHGVIDRIDKHPDGCRKILDYKSGGNYNGLKSDNLLQRRAIQLHLYKHAVESLLHTPVSGAAYYFMKEASGQRVELTDEAAAATQDELTAVLRVLNDGMRGGECWAYPEDNACRNCSVKAACGQDRFTRKWSNAREQTAAYRRIREGEA